MSAIYWISGPLNNCHAKGSCRRTAQSPALTAQGTPGEAPRSLDMTEQDNKSEFVLAKDPGFWIAQILTCAVIVALGLVIWYVQT
jgi:hypothetical protein